jgi:hypothetical protein
MPHHLYTRTSSEAPPRSVRSEVDHGVRINGSLAVWHPTAETDTHGELSLLYDTVKAAGCKPSFSMHLGTSPCVVGSHTTSAGSSNNLAG